MHLEQLVTEHALAAKHGVPDWMLGCFKRYCISFANGETDLDTHVFWVQSRNFTIDLRLPKVDELVPPKALADYSLKEIENLANYEGWEALCDWHNDQLAWRDTEASLQLHNRWTEPGILKRTGNCLIEFSPSNAYVEDWRLQPSRPGPLIGLRLIEERDFHTQQIRHKGGGLIICGDYAGLVLGRAQPLSPGSTAIEPTSPNALRTYATAAVGNQQALEALFNFETSIAKRDQTGQFKVDYSTQPSRLSEPLSPLDGFSWFESPGSSQPMLRQTLCCDGIECERLYTIDTLEPEVAFELSTGFKPEAATWFEQEAATLTRYTQILS